MLLLPGASDVSADETLQTTGELALPEENLAESLLYKLENTCFGTVAAKTFKQTKEANSNDRPKHKNRPSSKCLHVFVALHNPA